MSTILPALELDEALEETETTCVAGRLFGRKGLVTVRPLRAPHHTVSNAGLINGGRYPRPGEVSLAHSAVLFLDELPEFRRNVTEGLRQPLEEAYVSIVTAGSSLKYPASFVLVAAMNPCLFLTVSRDPFTSHLKHACPAAAKYSSVCGRIRQVMHNAADERNSARRLSTESARTSAAN